MSRRRTDVAAVLARHGVDPGADATALLRALEVRGWEASVEEMGVEVGRPRGRWSRYRALTFKRRPAPDVGADRGSHAHYQAGGRTAEEALGRVLAAVLELGG